MTEHARGPRGWYIVAGLLVTAFLAGLAVGAIAISHGALLGSGNYQNQVALTWWTQQAAANSTIPSPAPSALSTAASSPTVLPSSSATFALNSQTVGDGAVEIDFTEATTASVNTEVELTFRITVGTSPVTSSLTVYIETQATAPPSAHTYSIYFDGGAGTLVFDNVQQISQLCAAVGTCP